MKNGLNKIQNRGYSIVHCAAQLGWTLGEELVDRAAQLELVEGFMFCFTLEDKVWFACDSTRYGTVVSQFHRYSSVVDDSPLSVGRFDGDTLTVMADIKVSKRDLNARQQTRNLGLVLVNSEVA